MRKESVDIVEQITPLSPPEPSSKIGRAIQEKREWFEALTPSCPQDGTQGKFQRYEGAYTRTRGVFKCDNGHEFFFG